MVKMIDTAGSICISARSTGKKHQYLNINRWDVVQFLIFTIFLT
jgi:hypothetical protein